MSAPWKGPLRVEPSDMPDLCMTSIVADDEVFVADCQTVEAAAALVSRANAHEGLRKALHTIASEPIGDPEASAVQVLADVVDIARAALARAEGAGT